MLSGDGKTRDLVSSMSGHGWDFGMSRHPYFEFERPLGPHYTVYNRRLMACCFDQQSIEDGYWLLRQKAAVLHTGERPIEFNGPDAEALLDKLFTKDITKLKIDRCAYGLACYDDGGLIVDGILLRLGKNRFWYAQADGDFFSWAKAHASDMNVEVFDPEVYVTQVQGPNAMRVLAEASDGGMLESFPYFSVARVFIAGEEVIITRTGYTNEIGWEFYTEVHHDADAIWQQLIRAGSPFGLAMHGLDSMNIRRIEAGILNAGSDFSANTSPYAVGLGRFVDAAKTNTIGAAALRSADKKARITGLKCSTGVPHISGGIFIDGHFAGSISAGAHSPFLKAGVGIGLLLDASHTNTQQAEIECVDGTVQPSNLVEMPFYDKAGDLVRGKLVL